jgi:hypothetical protein
MAPGKGGYMGYEFYARYDESDRTLEVAWHGGIVAWWHSGMVA